MKKLLLIGALAALEASATVITQTQSTAAYPSPGLANPWGAAAGQLTFQGFLLAGGSGTLNSVTISVNPIFNTSSIVYDNTTSAFNGTFSESITRQISVTNAAAMTPYQVSATACVTSGTVNAGTTNTQACAEEDPAAALATAILAGWNVNANVVLQTGGNFSRSGSVNNVDVINNNLFSAVEVTVTYDYTPTQTGVPEPGTMALLGSALVGLGMMARRKQ